MSFPYKTADFQDRTRHFPLDIAYVFQYIELSFSKK